MTRPDSTALLAMEYVAQNLRVAYAQGHNVEARYKMSMAAMLGALREAPSVAAAAQHLAPTWDVTPEALLAELLVLCRCLESRGLLETHVAE